MARRAGAQLVVAGGMTSGGAEADFAALALRDRAARFLGERGQASEDELLTHVYGGPAPVSLRERLAAPLLSDPRLERRPDGSWALRGRAALATSEFSALALVATGPSPARARVVRVCALHVSGHDAVARFDAIVNPGIKHVPRYVLDRLGQEAELLEHKPPFADVLDDLLQFLGDRPLLAQDARLTWAFVDAEARRTGRTLVEPPLLDVNELAGRLLDLKNKPSLSIAAARLGISSIHITHPLEEARVLAEVGARLLGMVGVEEAAAAAAVLRRGSTARSLPDEPGVYVLRDRDQTPLYVGKARRLRSRMTAYVHRPLGATRRLEGLVAAVSDVDTTQCATDLQALILEDREIRRLNPQFNTVRQQRSPRYWIALPPAVPGRALPRLELSAGPSSGAQAEFVGPFRNQMLAEQARALTREVFGLDPLRRTDPFAYASRLDDAMAFLRGDSSIAEQLARRASAVLLRKVVAFDVSRLLLSADPREARYAVVRPGPTSVEGFLIDHALLRAWTTFDDGDTYAFAQRLLSDAEPRTTADDVNVVLRWLGAQHLPARIVWLPDESLAASDAIEDALLQLTAREA